MTKGHPRECHKCRFNGKTDASARRACISCPGPAAVSYKGISFVYPDGIDKPENIYQHRDPVSIPTPRREPITATLNEKQESALASFLEMIATLSDEDATIMRYILKGHNIKEAGERVGFVKQLAYLHVKGIYQRFPVLRSIIAPLAKRAAKRGTLLQHRKRH